MSDLTRGARSITLAALLLGIILALGAGAAPDTGSGLKIAVIDPERALNEYKGTVESNKNLKQLYDKYQVTLQTIRQSPLLEEAEQNRLAELNVKEAQQQGGLNAAEVTEKKKLTDKSDAAIKEFQGLQQLQIGNANQQQKDRVTQLTKLAGDTDNRLALKSKEADDDLNKQRTANQKKVLKDVKEAIAVIAKKQSITLVLSGEFALYGETDVTDAVLKQLNGK